MAKKLNTTKKPTEVVDKVDEVVEKVVEKAPIEKAPDVKHLMVGYGTFITRMMFRKDSNSRVVTVKGFRRVFDPHLAGFPFVLPDPASSFKGIVFDVKDATELRSKDGYEGCHGDPLKDDENAGLYYRAQTEIVDTDGVTKKAWIYVPSKRTREQYHVDLGMDVKDSWQGRIAEMLSYHRSQTDLAWMRALLPDEYPIPKRLDIGASDDEEESEDE